MPFFCLIYKLSFFLEYGPRSNPKNFKDKLNLLVTAEDKIKVEMTNIYKQIWCNFIVLGLLTWQKLIFQTNKS